MAGPTPKLKGDLEGDTPEQVAWGLLEWVRLVEDVRDRQGILGAFHHGLMTAQAGFGQEPGAGSAEPTGSQRRIAYKLAHLVAEMEGRTPGQRNQGDRTWVMSTYAECLAAVLGRWKPA